MPIRHILIIVCVSRIIFVEFFFDLAVFCRICIVEVVIVVHKVFQNVYVL